MSSAQSKASAEAQGTYANLGRQAYDIALPAMDARNAAVNDLRANGMPAFLSSAFDTQRTGLAEDFTNAQRANLPGGAMGSGGNFSGITAQQMGAQLANALYGSRFTQARAGLDETFNAMQMSLGGAGTAGSGALTAAGNQLRGISYLPGYNQTYANILGVADTAALLYRSFPQGQAAIPGSALGGVGMVEPDLAGNAAASWGNGPSYGYGASALGLR